MQRANRDDHQDNAMSRRHRGHGEGTIVERPSKDGATKHRAQVLVRGRRLGKTFPTRTEARRWIRTTLADADRGLLTPEGDKVTLGDYLPRWLDAAKPAIRPMTLKCNEQIIRLHLAPAFRKHRLGSSGRIRSRPSTRRSSPRGRRRAWSSSATPCSTAPSIRR
jgi:hypothetical protein